MIEQVEKSTEKKYNSVCYFILPMLQLNKSSFGVGNYVESYIDSNGYVVVDLKRSTAMGNVPTNTYNHPQYVTDYDTEDTTRVVYFIPNEFRNDVEKYINGKYSELSAELKVAISKYANLPTNDLIIKSLNPQMKERQEKADDLGVRVELIKELFSAPHDGNFIKIK